MNRWIDVCGVDDLQPDSGVCAQVAGHQVAMFHLPKLDAVYSLDNFDPIAQANVLSRGMVGHLGGEPMVASPMYKQHYNLKTGVCFEDASVRLTTYRLRIADHRVWLQVDEHGVPVAMPIATP